MEENQSMINMQKLLYLVKELHARGYEKLRVIPSMSPSGASWRCTYMAEIGSEKFNVIDWLRDSMDVAKQTEYTIAALTDKFENENGIFLKGCKGKNDAYVAWFSDMLSKLTEGELPYAFSDYYSQTDYWRTTKRQEIITLPDEKRFY